MGMGCFRLPLLRPRSPPRGFLLGNPDQHHPVFTFAGRRFQVGLGQGFLGLTLEEVHHRNLVLGSKLVNRLHVGIPDLAKRGRRRNPELPLPAQEDADLPHRLEFGHVRLQEDSVYRTALECHMISQ